MLCNCLNKPFLLLYNYMSIYIFLIWGGFLILSVQSYRVEGHIMINYTNMLWFGLCFFFLILEMGHPGLLYFLSFSCGSLVALFVSALGCSLQWQMTLFLLGTCIALLGVHLFVKEKMKRLQSLSHRSNTDALIGRKVVVYRSNYDGQVWYAQVDGQVWVVRCVQDRQLHEGQEAIIVQVKGCHLRVETKN